MSCWPRPIRRRGIIRGSGSRAQLSASTTSSTWSSAVRVRPDIARVGHPLARPQRGARHQVLRRFTGHLEVDRLAVRRDHDREGPAAPSPALPMMTSTGTRRASGRSGRAVGRNVSITRSATATAGVGDSVAGGSAIVVGGGGDPTCGSTVGSAACPSIAAKTTVPSRAATLSVACPPPAEPDERGGRQSTSGQARVTFPDSPLR